MSKVLTMVRELGDLKRHRTLKMVTTVSLAAIVFFSIFLSGYSENVNKGLADNLIRLHVIANSDSPEDQSLKRDVRDAILEYMQVRLKDSKDIDQTRSIINSEMNEIKKIAADVIKSEGKSYNVKGMLGNYPFPTKMYGDIVLPAGEYEALRVVIGDGAGQNWWCVLFPPLCFVDVSHGTVPESVKNDLKNHLTKSEYKMVTSAGNDDDIPVKVKFKIVEFFQSSKVKFTGMLSKIFR